MLKNEKLIELQQKLDSSKPQIKPWEAADFAVLGYSYSEVIPFVISDQYEARKLFMNFEQEIKTKI